MFYFCLFTFEYGILTGINPTDMDIVISKHGSFFLSYNQKDLDVSLFLDMPNIPT